MNAREYLGQIRQCNATIQILEIELAEAKELLTCVGSVSNDPNKVQTSRNLHRQENLICDVMALEEEYIGLLSDKVKLRKEIITLVGRVKDPDCRSLLHQRYVLCKKWYEVSSVLGFSESHTKEFLDDKAIGLFQEVLDIEQQRELQ